MPALAVARTARIHRPQNNPTALTHMSEPLLLLAPPRQSRGRPSTYDPSFCDRVIELMGEGLSFAAVAGALGVSRDTIYAWAEVHPEFSDTKKTGKAAAQLFWERQLIATAKGLVTGSPTTAIIFGLKNRAPLDWRDKTEVEHKGTIPVAITPRESLL